ncbi:MAG: hypothetical protein GY893_13390 [bacterium]|nr:hypothetical protein [bacterium]
MQSIIANPNSAEQVITDRIKFVQSQGGDPTQTINELVKLKEVGPEQYAKTVEMGYSMLDPTGFNAFNKTKGDPNADLIRQEMLLGNQLKQAQIADAKAQTSMRGQPTAKQLAEEEKLASKSQEAQQKVQDDIYTTNQNIAAIDDLLGNKDYINSLTGYAGRFPVNVTDAGVEAETYFDNIKNNLTIENLGVMSGPLTDTDIKIISNAASRLNKGMTEANLRKELNLIKKTYNRMKTNYAKQAKQGGYEVDLTEGVVESGGGNYNPSQAQIDLVAKYSNMPTQ